MITCINTSTYFGKQGLLLAMAESNKTYCKWFNDTTNVLFNKLITWPNDQIFQLKIPMMYNMEGQLKCSNYLLWVLYPQINKKFEFIVKTNHLFWKINLLGKFIISIKSVFFFLFFFWPKIFCWTSCTYRTSQH